MLRVALVLIGSAALPRAPARGSILSSCNNKPWRGCPEEGGSRLGEKLAGFSEAMAMYDDGSDKSGSTSAWTGENGLDRAASKVRRSGPGLPRAGSRQVTYDFARNCCGTLRVRKGYSAVQ